MHICVSGRLVLFIHGGFETEAAAQAWADNANRWYGEGHPLHPIRVEPLTMNPATFPVEAFERMSEAETPEEQDDAMRAMFATLVDDPSKAPPGKQGGRKR